MKPMPIELGWIELETKFRCSLLREWKNLYIGT